MPASVPEVLAAWMRPFRGYFTAAVWRHALVLVAGAVLAPGRRTVTAALRVMGLGQAPGFAVHHRVLSHARWSSRAVAHRLLRRCCMDPAGGAAGRAAVGGSPRL